MKYLLKYFKGYQKECILGPLFKLLEASFELLIPLVVVRIINEGIAHESKTIIWQMCGVMILLGLIGLVCSLTAQYYSARAAVGFAAKVKHALFAHIQSFSYAEIDHLGTSAMVTRMTSDMNQLQSGVNMTLRLFLRSPFIVIGAMLMAFSIDNRIAWIFLIVILLLSVVVYGIMFLTIPMYRKVQERLDALLRVTRSGLKGVRVIRAFGLEQKEKNDFQDTNTFLVQAQVLVGRISALMNPLTFAIINIGIAWLVWSGAIQVNQGNITQGEVVALVNYMSQILVELIKLANLIIIITKAAACAGRVEDVLKTESSMKEGTITETEKQPVEVCFSGVSFQYSSAAGNAITEINFMTKPGSVMGIIGGTGSGKTTLINLIGRFYDVTKGKISVNGRDVKEYTFDALRSMIGVVPQKSVLFSGSIRKNLQWGNAKASDEELWQALKIAQAEDFVKSKEGGLDYMVSQGGSNFSGGQRQRLAIARALVKKPSILILDDSASALDYATDAALRKAIQEMIPSPTLFLISQRTASMLHANQILVLEDGQTVGIGTHQELLKSCEVYQEIYESQYGGGSTEGSAS